MVKCKVQFFLLLCIPGVSDELPSAVGRRIDRSYKYRVSYLKTVTLYIWQFLCRFWGDFRRFFTVFISFYVAIPKSFFTHLGWFQGEFLFFLEISLSSVAYFLRFYLTSWNWYFSYSLIVVFVVFEDSFGRLLSDWAVWGGSTNLGHLTL